MKEADRLRLMQEHLEAARQRLGVPYTVGADGIANFETLEERIEKVVLAVELGNDRSNHVQVEKPPLGDINAFMDHFVKTQEPPDSVRLASDEESAELADGVPEGFEVMANTPDDFDGTLTSEEWDALQEILKNPPEPSPQLRKLFKEIRESCYTPSKK
jgi:hypothetical protein